MRKAKLSRRKILNATKVDYAWPKSVPKKVIREVERGMDDYIVAWTQGLAAHLQKVDAAARPAKRKSAKLPTRASASRRSKP